MRINPMHTMALASAGLILASAADAKPVRPHRAQGDWIQGVWESPWRPDQLRRPGEPEPPTEVGPPPLKAPYLAEWTRAQKAAAAATARGEPIAGGLVACIPPGFPSMMNPRFPVEVIATPRQINITNEAYAQTRRIYLHEQQTPIEDTEPGFFGHAVGRWEGDTLLVDTVGVKETVRQLGVPHSADMRVQERIYPTGRDTFEDRVTVTDPQFLERPWVFTLHFQRRPDYRLGEYVCENNREFADPVTGAQRLRLGPMP
jgi:hypothetical protein